MDALTKQRKKDDDEEKSLFLQSKKKPRPVILFKAIITPHPAFNAVRSVLYSPIFIKLIEKSLSICLQDANEKSLESGVSMRIISHCIYLLTLMIHCHPTMIHADIKKPNLFVSNNDATIINFFTIGFSLTGIAYGLIEKLISIWHGNLTKNDNYFHETSPNFD